MGGGGFSSPPAFATELSIKQLNYLLILS